MNSTNALIPPHLSAPRINRTVRFGFLALVGTALIALSAKVKVPMRPVEMSLQTLVVFALASAIVADLVKLAFAAGIVCVLGSVLRKPGAWQ